MFLEQLPLTPNGKVDRRGLEGIGRQQSEGLNVGGLNVEGLNVGEQLGSQMPRTPTEELLHQIWSRLLNKPLIGIYDNFFELGGHSLLATRVVAQVRQVFQVDLPLRDLFEQPTIALLADCINQAQTGMLLPLIQTTQERHILSFAQQRHWILAQIDPDNPSYNIPAAIRLKGLLNVGALQHCFETIVQRHEVLRTNFATVDGKPVAIVQPQRQIDCPMVDLSQVTPADRLEAHIQAIAQTEAEMPFAIDHSPLLRVKLLRMDDSDHVLLLTLHHIIADGWSINLLVREVALLYRTLDAGMRVKSQSLSSELSSEWIEQQLAATLPTLPIQYADFAAWQRDWLQGDRLNHQLTYWRQQLGDLPPLSTLPTDYPRPAIQSMQGDRLLLSIDQATTQQLQQISQASGCTLFMTLLAAFKILLHRHMQTNDIVIGTPIANRTQASTEGLIGCFANTLVLRTDLSGNPSFYQLLHRVRQVALEAYSHQDLPFEQLVEALQPERSLSYSPLFQIMFTFQPATAEGVLSEDQAHRTSDVDNTSEPVTWQSIQRSQRISKFDLTLSIQETADGLVTSWEYSRDLFAPATIQRITKQFQILLEGIIEPVTDPAATSKHKPGDRLLSQLPILTPTEQHQLHVWNQTQRDYPDGMIHQLFEAQVERTPEAIAAIHQHQQITYSDLNCRANQLAHYLIQQGAQPDRPIAVCMERSLDLIVALLAILKAGSAYLPLDPDYPAERLNFMLKDTQTQLLLTTELAALELATSEPLQIICVDTDSFKAYANTNPQPTFSSHNLAYIIYTSGSTGTPKGVAIEHRSTVSLLHWAADTFPPQATAGILASTSLCFDLSVFELFLPLATGGAIILADNALQLPTLPAAHKVTLLNTVPAIATQLLRLNSLPANLHTVNLAGEPLPQSLVQRLYQQPSIQAVYNLYGPSEDTTYSTFALVHPVQLIPPIGKPIANTQAYVLDGDRCPVPIGAIGELYLAGNGLARGYWNRVEMTAERFVEEKREFKIQNSKFKIDGLEDEKGLVRLYRTGDLVRFLADGNLEYHGRMDGQVKLRGFRIELGEVEAVLNQHPSVVESVVVVRERGEQSMLVAYVVSDPLSSGEELRAFVAERLPQYMVPTRFIELEALPRLANGKVDRRGLPELEPVVREASSAAPETELEKIIARIWQEALQCDRVGRQDSFFELGGHSLLGMTIMAKLGEALNREVPLRYLFQAPTVAGLAHLITAATEHQIPMAVLPPLVPSPAERYQPFPLTDIQQAYWIGRNEAFELGNVSTHGYREIEVVGLTIAQVEVALQQLINRHDMLRMVVREGQQVILETVPLYQIQVHDLTKDVTAEQVETQLLELRQQLSHHILTTDTYPLFDIQAACLDQHRVRFFISFDVLIGDAWSFQILAQELVQLLAEASRSTSQDSALLRSPASISFRDYVLAERQLRGSDRYQASQAYWQSRIPSLPPAPELPLSQNPGSLETPRFTRRSGELSVEQWQLFKQVAAKVGVTPSTALLAAFAEVLAHWSRQPRFTLNLTLFNRLPLHPEVNQLVGDFTSSTLLAIDCSDSPQTQPSSFAYRAQQVQAQLWQDLEHRYVSGVAVLRQLAQQQQRITGALMPVVFTSILTQTSSDSSVSDRPYQADVIYSLSQTSQVYLDHQVAEVEGKLIFNWDTIDELFPAGLLDQMFAVYVQQLTSLAQDSEAWQNSHYLEQVQSLLTSERDANTSTLQYSTLQQLFFEQAERQPHQVAIATHTDSFTYQDLRDRILHLTQQLHRQNLPPQSLIPILMEKSWAQVVAVLATLTAGFTYVPIDPDLPGDRQQKILDQINPPFIFTPQTFQQLSTSSVIEQPHEALGYNSSSIETDLAYIIYTSGSTGMPKGVMLTHRAVINTILDINQKFKVTASDRIFALSALSFDLSVYDMFGAFAAGATLVLPDADKLKEPEHWQTLIDQHQVTIWNSVPALMQLLLENGSFERNRSTDRLDAPKPSEQYPQGNTSLRLVLLSGDWIPLTLPQRIQQRFTQAKVISLGGATEAAIWSIYYPITEIDPNWKSIPYGRSLHNQSVFVLNHRLAPCRTWVTGQIYIGGVGLAAGYYQDLAKTDASFILHPQTGERLYKTGDLGRYLPDGNIEFLGREDFQIKVNGYRIELGEIEALLQQHPLVQDAIATVTDNQQLAAYIVPKVDTNAEQAIAKTDLKLQQSGVRSFAEVTDKLVLPTQNNANLRRQSYRRFLPEQISMQQFGEWISSLQAMSVNNNPLPKYRYASAGSLYPVQTYIYVKPDRIAGLDPGFYYYHPIEHALMRLNVTVESDDVTTFPAEIYGNNQSIFAQAAFSVFLIAQPDAMRAVYGDRTHEFSLLEAGYMSQLLMETAPEFDLGLCPVGTLAFESIQSYFQLQPGQLLLHSFIGGKIDPTWTTEWIVQTPTTQENLSDRLSRQLMEHLEQKLPNYMIPRRYKVLSSLPLTANGKVDRRALPSFDTAPQPHQFVAPRTEAERCIAAIWQDVLKQERISIEDNFFDLGGNSLSVTQVMNQLRQQFQTDLSIRQFFTHPTIAALAKILPDSIPAAAVIPTDVAIPKLDRLVASTALDDLSEQDLDSLLQQMLVEETE
jgi:amino acid adenylation domain-containing protein